MSIDFSGLPRKIKYQLNEQKRPDDNGWMLERRGKMNTANFSPTYDEGGNCSRYPGLGSENFSLSYIVGDFIIANKCFIVTLTPARGSVSNHEQV